MKKGMAMVVGVTLAVSLCATAALAAGRHHGTGAAAGTLSQGWNYVDVDGDGVCDNLGTECTGQSRYCVDADGDGVCDNLGTGCTGKGRYCMDADGDGVCDHLGTGCAGSHWGHGQGGCRN